MKDEIPLGPSAGSSGRETDEEPADLAVGDPRLGAVEPPVVALVAIAGGQARRIGAGVGFGEHETADNLPEASWGRNSAFCSSLPKVMMGQQHTELVTVIPTATAASTRASSSTAMRYDSRSIAGAAVLLGHHHPEQTELAHLGEDLVRKLTRAVALRRAGPNPVLGEGPHHLLNHLLLFVEGEVHGHLRWDRRESITNSWVDPL